jgi:ribokinase
MLWHQRVLTSFTALMIAVVGSVNLDLVARLPRLPAAGETLSATGFARVPGGKGANQALAARRMGADVRLMAAVGSGATVGADADRGPDAVAGEALALLRAEGVRLDRVRTVPGVNTGLALIQVDDAGDTTIVVVPGANAALRVTPEDLADADAVLTVLEVPMATVEAAAAHAPAGALFALNAAPAASVPEAVLRRADLVVVNRAEHAALGGALGAARCVAVTHGADGAVLLRNGAEVTSAAPPRVHAVDGTAAGDAFTAALVVAMLDSADDGQALRTACAAGALAASRHGAQPSLPTAADVDAILAR